LTSTVSFSCYRLSCYSPPFPTRRSSDLVIVQPSRQAFDTAVGLGPIRHLGRNARQLAALAADNTTDEHSKARQMLGQTAAGLARIPLFQGLTYGTIASKVVTHRIPLLI